MPRKGKHTLTAKEAIAAETYALTGSYYAAQERAGYKGFSGAYEAIKRPAVQAEIRRVSQNALDQELLPLAIAAHKRLLTDPKVPAGAVATAVKLAYDRTLGLADPGGKSPEEMTPAELAEAIERLHAERSRKAQIVDAVVIEKSDQARDVFE